MNAPTGSEVPVQKIRGWLLRRDGQLRAVRRATRTAIVMPALFAVGWLVIGDPAVATFAAFGAFALLLLADFGGTLAERLAAQAALVAVGCAFIALATLASGSPWTAAGAMFVVGFLVMFAGALSSVLAGATTSALLGFILPVATPGPAGSIPDRLVGWLLAGAVSLLAVGLLWPVPRREPLREAAAEACRRLSERLTAEVAWRLTGSDAGLRPARADADAAVAALRTTFLATPYRPAGLSTAARAVVRLVDEIAWLGVVLDRAAAAPRSPTVDPTVCAVKSSAAVLLDHAGKALDLRRPPQDSLQDHLDDLGQARRALEAAAIDAVAEPLEQGDAGELAARLAPGFRAQELTFAITAIAENVAIASAAEQRTWWQKLIGRRPEAVGPWATARHRGVALLAPHSVWLHNSVRGAFALAVAVLVADLSGAQHSFWIVLGALSVLRSNALSTGQDVARGLLGTAAGFAIGGALVLAIGGNAAVLWALLPIAVLLAGVAPALSFTAGQAGFTTTLLILFNIISPAGWQVGVVRIEDVAIGCAVSLVVGILFWPRGAAAALRRQVAEAYAECATYLRFTADSGPPRPGQPATAAGSRATAAARRLDDAFREFLAERGPKHLSLAQVATLLTGVAGLRLTADAVSGLWRITPDGDDGGVGTPRARQELLDATERITNWFAAMAQAVAGIGAVPRPLRRDDALPGRLLDALRADLGTETIRTRPAREHVVRLVWTVDHLDTARHLQPALEGPGQAAAAGRRPGRAGRIPPGAPGPSLPPRQVEAV